ncbi:Insulin-like growth factor binding protein, N-terminal [Pseudocohnilembus persalinus]|uniref:Insulin-like growth factor binding protein, N-terminal n=1 Tax=Pseudocohnilembus persalinus TaxID=266149 RepID=A0A0V0R9G7_PSEPJ|nr:Insulin-like growth factor binding protein, N-terminal [Pseudocohnilembus persalinus]|eukprot:KRX11115.1 Insulin-like growth factor binding protein, N-terminal [Pseudocohnilembus persalinus]
MSVNETQISQEPVDIYDKLHVESGHYNQNIISLDHFDFQVHGFTIHDGEYYTPVIQFSQKVKGIQFVQDQKKSDISQQWLMPSCSYAKNTQTLLLTYKATIIDQSLPDYASSEVMKGKIQFSEKFDNFYPQFFDSIYQSNFLIVNNDVVSLDDEYYAISSIIFPPQDKYQYFYQSDAQGNSEDFYKVELYFAIYDQNDQECSDFCQTCLNDTSICQTCISSRISLPLCDQCSISDPPRIEEENCRCPDTYYDNGKDHQCQVCNKQCLTCESHALNCTSCPKENYKPESQCTKCIDGYYNYNGYTDNCLLKCPSECKTCYNYEQCLTCKENYTYNPYTMKCQICENHYIWNQFSKQCQKCLYYQKECVLICPLNTKLNENTFVCQEINYEIKSNVQSYYLFGGIYCLYLVILYFIIGRKVVKILRQRFNGRGQGRQNQQQYQQVQNQNNVNNNIISNDINQRQNQLITTEQSESNLLNQNSLSSLNTESPLKKSKRKVSQRFRKISQHNLLQSQNLDIIQETQREDRPKEQGQSIIIDEEEEEEQKQQKNQKLSQNQQDQYLLNNQLSDDIYLHTQQTEQQQQQLINTSMILNQNEEIRQVDENFEEKIDFENKIQPKNTSQILNQSNQQNENSQQNSQNILYQNSNLVASMIKDRKKKRNQQQVFSQTLSQFQIKDSQQMQTSQLIENNNNNQLSQNLDVKNNNKNISINIKDQSTFKVSDFQDFIN